jgi:hypothetical protein
MAAALFSGRGGQVKVVAVMLKLLTPSIAKIGLTLILLVVSAALWRAYIIAHIGDSFPFGFPFVFWESWGPCRPGENCAAGRWWALMLDIIIWYSVSAVILTRRSSQT